MKTKEEILDICIDAMRSGATVAEALKPYPEWKEELAPLLAMGAELSSLPEPKINLTTMMQSMGEAMATEVPTVGKSKAILFPRPVLLRIAATLAIVLALGWGTLNASASALPGDWLYSLKLLTERARFVLSINPEDKAELRITFSERRLKEMVKKYEQGSGLDQALLKEMLDEAALALEAIPALPADSRDLVAARVLSSSRFQEESLKRIHEKATPEEQKTLKPYMELCAQRCDWISKRMDTPESWSDCGSGSEGSSCPW